MVPIAMLVTILGYTVLYAGLQEWNGCSWSFTDIIWPGGAKYTPCKGSSGGGGGTSLPGGKNVNPYGTPGDSTLAPHT